MIRLENVSAGYARGQDVLKSVSFHLEPGAFYFLTGASGAGKSTLLKILALTLAPKEGDVHLFGTNARHLSHARMPEMRRKMGMVFQDYQLLDHLTVAENIALPLKVGGERPHVIRAKVHELLEWMELAPYADVHPTALSGGQKQRVSIARAVIGSPKVLLADEPTGNLDPALSLKFMHLFQALNQMGTAILFATHDENLISLFDYPVLRLKGGNLTQREKNQAT